MRVLIAEDDGFSRRFLAHHITQWGYEIVFAETGHQAWDILQSQDAPRLVLLNWMLPCIDGLELCKKVRLQQRSPSTYIIMFTSNCSTADLVAAVNVGADDFVTKSFDIRELEVRLRAGKRIVELEQALWVLATRDSLTKLWNRSAILETLDREFARAARQGTFLGVVMADIDHFKHINDTYGHRGGDALLTQLSQRLVRELRKYDTVGRYGGEEFLIVLPQPLAADTQVVAERLRQVVTQTSFQIERQTIPITMSFGAVAVSPSQQITPDILVRAADEALYRAKANGRNRVEFQSRLAESFSAASV
ncbi:MAG: diguanylate cyclase [Actinobacteria bacterium]|nr:diguanylate cyclase [Actinomycetota bacterium]